MDPESNQDYLHEFTVSGLEAVVSTVVLSSSFLQAGRGFFLIIFAVYIRS